MELEKFLQAMEIPYHDIEIFKQAFTHTCLLYTSALNIQDYGVKYELEDWRGII